VTGGLGGKTRRLDLPTDRPRPAVRSHRGSELNFDVPATTLAALGNLAWSSDATACMAQLAAFQDGL
jgi:hypothetical protein